MDAIKVGDKVRSFDNEYRRDVSGTSAYYVEGVVTGFMEREACLRYEIEVKRDVYMGRDVVGRLNCFVYPPVNGTPRLFSDGPCDYVVKLEGGA